MHWDRTHISKTAKYGAYVATKVAVEGTKLAIILPIKVCGKVASMVLK